MGFASDALHFALHPKQLRLLCQWKFSQGLGSYRDLGHESETAETCFRFLDKTSRSFSRVVKELHADLLMPVCVFYLVLRGLDTIEDDTSIPLEEKEPLILGFKDRLDQDGWTFTGNRAEEKDRQLLVRFDNVITEFKKLKPVYRAIIKDITSQMGEGMASFARKAKSGDAGLDTVDEYDLYCWYVAGVVGEGLTRLFVEAGLGQESLIEQSRLYRSMGLSLQKNNIIRDVREDYDDGRRFWPKEIWAKHVDDFEELFKPEKMDFALNCSSEMVLNALGHTNDCLSYLDNLHEQSLFNFCAIPQAMAMATLELCFRNPAVFQRNVKLTRGDMLHLFVESSQNTKAVCEIFARYASRIRQKNCPADPNFLEIDATCRQIEEFSAVLACQFIQARTEVDYNHVTKYLLFAERRVLFVFCVLSAVVLLVGFGLGSNQTVK